MSEYTLAHQSLEEAVVDWAAAQNAHGNSEDDFRRAVRRAFASGVPAREIAATVRLSLARVYQIRDGTR